MKITQVRGPFAVVVAAALIVAATVWWVRSPATMVASQANTSKATTGTIPVSKGITATSPVAKLTRPKRPTTATRATAAGTDVGTDFWATSDYFDFVQRYAPQALTDNRAAFWVADAARRCWGTVELHRRVPSDPHIEMGLEKCRGFLDGDAFAALPPRAGGYDWRFFHDRAIAGGEPIAVLSDVAFEHRNPDEVVHHTEVIEAVDAAIRTGDPHAYWMVAGLLMMPDFAVDPLDAFAWQLVACEYGVDCRMGNPQVGAGCADHGFCNPDETVLDNMRINAGLDITMKVEARAASIIAELDAGRMPDIRLHTEAPAWWKQFRAEWDAEFEAAYEAAGY